MKMNLRHRILLFIIYTILVSSSLYHCVKSVKVIRTVAANGQGVDIRGCGIEGYVKCNTTQFAIFESNNVDEIILLKGIHTYQQLHRRQSTTEQGLMLPQQPLILQMVRRWTPLIG